MNKWLFTYFCLYKSLVHDEDVRLALSLQSLPFVPHITCFISKHTDVEVDSWMVNSCLKTMSQSRLLKLLRFHSAARVQTVCYRVQFSCKLRVIFVQCFSRWQPHRGQYLSYCTPLLFWTIIHSLIYSYIVWSECNDIWMKWKNKDFTWKCPRISVNAVESLVVFLVNIRDLIIVCSRYFACMKSNLVDLNEY